MNKLEVSYLLACFLFLFSYARACPAEAPLRVSATKIICDLVGESLDDCKEFCVQSRVSTCTNTAGAEIDPCLVTFKGQETDLFSFKANCTSENNLCVAPVGMTCIGTCDCATEPFGSRLPNGVFLGVNNCPLSTLDGFCFDGVACTGGDRSLFNGLINEEDDNSGIIIASISSAFVVCAGVGLFVFRRQQIAAKKESENRVTIDISDLRNVTFDNESSTTITDKDGNTYIIMPANKKNSEMLF